MTSEHSIKSAIQDGDLGGLGLLFTSGASVNCRDSDGYAPLHYAAQFGRVEIARRLIDWGADVNLKMMSAHHYPPAPGEVESTEFKESITPLFLATEAGHEEMVAFLIARGADVNIQEEFSGETPLHCAARNGQLGIARILLDAGADINAIDGNDQPPLALSAKGYYYKLTKLLFSQGAVVNKQTERILRDYGFDEDLI